MLLGAEGSLGVEAPGVEGPSGVCVGSLDAVGEPAGEAGAAAAPPPLLPQAVSPSASAAATPPITIFRMGPAPVLAAQPPWSRCAK
ncbi:hypothetical protein J4709_27985 [Actinomadura sp. LCR2-06]|uniref:Uncharacterized protein n=1 Tax=Actinomadura violacea TaxID=2819934 RepID=A0ABS3RXE3_9ACTN|nr:hypothetical protein [Actinomadura violacea]